MACRPISVFSPDSLYLTVLGQDNHLRVWNTNSGKEFQDMKMPMPQERRAVLQWRGNRLTQAESIATYMSIVAGAAAAIRGWAGVRPARLETPAIARRTS